MSDQREPIVWTDPGGCSSCKFCSMDMEMDPYCVHPTVTKTPRGIYGVLINRALQTCKLKLREERPS